MSTAGFVAVLCAQIVRMKGHVVRSRSGSTGVTHTRLRLPVFLMVVGYLFALLGAGMLVVSLAGGYFNPWPMFVASLLVLGMGVAFALMYRNWYLEPDSNEIRYRTIWGVRRVISYRDIAEHGWLHHNGQSYVTIRSVQGHRLTINVTEYDVVSLIDHLRARENAASSSAQGPR